MRDTATEPSKSGVVGLLACALGWKQDADLRRLSEQIRMGVRCDRPGVLITDYHTVIGGVLSAEGKVKKNAKTREPETVVSWRRYICDASFLVALQSDDEAMIARLADAVQNPHWPIYLGRKSCPPSCPPFVGVGQYDLLQEALAVLPLPCLSPPATTQVRAVVECASGQGVCRRDEVGLRSRRTFLPRYTQDIVLTVSV